jgi:hypothetical protein
MPKRRNRRAKTTSARKIRANRRNGLKGGRPRRTDAEAALRGDPRRRPVESAPPPIAAPQPSRPVREYQNPDGSFVFATGSGSLLPPPPKRRRRAA